MADASGRSSTDAKASGFVFVVSEKTDRDASDDKLQRAFQSLALKRHVEAAAEQMKDSQLVYLPGAGVALQSGCSQAIVDGRWLSVFVGEIENYAYLVKKYCLAEAGLDPDGTFLLETVRAMSMLNDAEVVALLFKKLGPTYMTKVKGNFAYCIYDAHFGRVLAVSDRQRTHCMWQDHLAADDSLLVACNVKPDALSLDFDGSGKRAVFGAGEYKFGWRSNPVAYAASEAAVVSRGEEARNAAMAALMSASTPVDMVRKPGPPVRHSIGGAVVGAGDRHSFRQNSLPTRQGSLPFPSRTGALPSPSAQTPAATLSRQGSYVPPHRRTSVDASRSISGAAAPAGRWGRQQSARYSVDGQNWRTSMDSTNNSASGGTFARAPAPYAPRTSIGAAPPQSPHGRGAQQAAGSVSQLTSVFSQSRDGAHAVPALSQRFSGSFDYERSSVAGPIVVEGFTVLPTHKEEASSSTRGGGGGVVGLEDDDGNDVQPDQQANTKRQQPAARSNLTPRQSAPIPIRASRDSHANNNEGSWRRPTAAAFGTTGTKGVAVTDGDGKRDKDAADRVASSVESLASDSDSDLAREAIAAAFRSRRISSLQFDCSEMGSSSGRDRGKHGEVRHDSRQTSSSQAHTERSLDSLEHTSVDRALSPTFRDTSALPVVSARVAEAREALKAAVGSINSEKLMEAARSGSITLDPGPISLDNSAGVSAVLQSTFATTTAHTGDAAARFRPDVSVLFKPYQRQASASSLGGEDGADVAGFARLDLHARTTSGDSGTDESIKHLSVALLASAASPVPSGALIGESPRATASVADSSQGPVPGAPDAQAAASEAAGDSDASGCRSAHQDSSGAASAKPRGAGRGSIPYSGSFSDALAQLLQSRSAMELRSLGMEKDPIVHGPVCGLSPCNSSSVLVASTTESEARVRGTEESGAAAAALGKDSAASESVHVAAGSGGSAGGSGERSLPRAALPPGQTRTLPPELLNDLVGTADSTAKAMLASLMYSSPCALCIVDARAEDQPVVYCNAIFEVKTGYAFEDVVGRNCRFLQAPPGVQRQASFATMALNRAVRLGRSHSCKLLNFSKDGKPLWNHLSIVPVRTSTGNVTHYLGMQTFTAASVSQEVVDAGLANVVRGVASHQCLYGLGDAAQQPDAPLSMHGPVASMRNMQASGRSSSYPSLTSLSHCELVPLNV